MFIRALMMAFVLAAEDGGAGAGAAGGSAGTAAGAGAGTGAAASSGGAGAGAGAAAAAGAGAGTGAAAGAGGGQAVTLAFADTLPEDLRGDPSLRDIKDLAGLTKSYVNATKLIGGRPEDLIKLPGADDAAGWDGVWSRLGRPEKADGYAFTAKVPDGVTIDPKFEGAYREAAHKFGLSAKTADALHGWWNEQAGAARQAAIAADTQFAEASKATLQQEWGAAYETKLGQARAAINEFFGGDFAAMLEQSRFGNDPRMVRGLAKLGATLAEDGVQGRGGSGGGSGPLSPAEAQQQINALKADPAFVKSYTSAKDPGHAEAMAKMTRLFQFANPPRG